MSDDWALAQGTVDARNEERMARHGRTTQPRPKVCRNPGCRRLLKPYSPPTRAVPAGLGNDPYCSRACLSAHLKVPQRAGKAKV